MKKLLALLAGLALIAVAQPAQANTEPVAANVTGGLELGLDTNCDLNDDGEIGPDETETYTATFTGVVITGTFTSPGEDYTGQVTTPSITACVNPSESVEAFGSRVPVISSGVIYGGGFSTPGTSVGISDAGNPACLQGTITGGDFTTTGVVAEAIFDLHWRIFQPEGGTCDTGELREIGAADEQPVTANVAAIPLGNAIPGTPSVVSGVVHAP